MLMPGAEHRYCVRHMYANFKDKFKGKELKDLMWTAAHSLTIQEFEVHTAKIASINPDAHAWLMTESPTLWARCMFSPRSKCDILSNNMSESFNHYINEARDKPIITMMKMIRRQLMDRYQEKREWVSKFPGPLCPRIFKHLENEKKEARSCEVMYAGGAIYEVFTTHRTHIADLGTHTCTCSKWDLTGIPCTHAIAAIITDKRQPEDFVHDYYRIETLKLAYEPIITPIPDSNLWVHTEFDPIMPPKLRRPPGRPKKVRRKAVDEAQNPYRVRKNY